MIKSVLELRKKITLLFPEGLIDAIAIKEAEDVVNRFNCCEHIATFKYPSPLQLYNESGWDLWFLPRGEFAGTWPKRYLSWCQKRFGVKVPPNLVSQLGEVLARHSKVVAEHVVDFTDRCDWEPGDFYENESSCWWNDFEGARLGLFDNGGMAMRFWDGERGIGRCWMHEKRGAIYMFNAYHRNGLTLSNMAHLLATHLGLSYAKVDISAPRAYINGDYGYAVGDTKGGRVTLEFAWDTENDDEDECNWCHGMYSRENENWFTIEDSDEHLCERCFTNHAFTCRECEGYFFDDDSRTGADGRMYCGDCWDNIFMECQECSETIFRDEAKEFEKAWMCQTCYEKETKDDCESLKKPKDAGKWYIVGDVRRRFSKEMGDLIGELVDVEEKDGWWGMKETYLSSLFIFHPDWLEEVADTDDDTPIVLPQKFQAKTNPQIMDYVLLNKIKTRIMNFNLRDDYYILRIYWPDLLKMRLQDIMSWHLRTGLAVRYRNYTAHEFNVSVPDKITLAIDEILKNNPPRKSETVYISHDNLRILTSHGLSANIKFFKGWIILFAESDYPIEIASLVCDYLGEDFALTAINTELGNSLCIYRKGERGPIKTKTYKEIHETE